MRVLIVQPWIRVGGAELLSLHLAYELEQLGHEAPIAALFVDRAGLPPHLASRRYHLPPRWLASLLQRSRALMLLVGPFALLAIVARAGARADCLNPHNLPGPVVAAIVGRLRRVPIVWQVNEVPEPTLRMDRPAYSLVERIAWTVGSALARWSAAAPASLLVLSEVTRTAVRDRYGRDATIVRAGADPCTGTSVARRSHSVRLIFVGKLVPQKDPMRAIRVTTRLIEAGVDAELVIVGDGPLRRDVRAAAMAALPGRATVLARVNDVELRELYRSADLLLVTADARQSWGLTPFEALACGTPAVVSREVGAAEVLGPRDAALLVEPTDAAFVAAALRLLRDDALRARLLANGADLTRELTWRSFAESSLDAFARAVTRGG